jgi:FkbM family methyltransferase
MKIFFPYLRKKNFRFELQNGVTIPGQPIDEYITKWMFIHGYQKELEFAMTHSLIRNGDVILDIGANMGLWSMIPAAIHGSKIKIHAFEPVPELFHKLVENIKENKIESSYITYNIALSETDGELIFNRDNNNCGMGYISSVADTSFDQIKIQSKVLSDIRKNHRIDKVDFIKIDVEGAELQVLRGDKYLFMNDSAPLLTIEVIDENQKRFGHSANELIQQLIDWGYKLSYLNESIGRLEDFDNNSIGIDVHNVLAYKAHHLDRLKQFVNKSGP